jgi:hypothetical protein
VSGLHSKRKGASGEREIRDRLNQYILPDGEPVVAKRGCQHAGGPLSPDVAHNIQNLHLEVKRCEAMSPSKARESLAQASRDAGENLPVVVWRSNRTDWVAMLSFAALLELLGCTECDPTLGKKETHGK